jgi:hypothetical protein
MVRPMQFIEPDTLDEVIGGAANAAENWTTSLDRQVSRVNPGWTNMTCTSRGMWVGTAAGAATSALGSGISAIPVPGLQVAQPIGNVLAPIAGAYASTSYIEGCEAAKRAMAGK